jgi:hypothetical protein
MVVGSVVRESSLGTSSASLRTPLKFLTSEHMQPASAESKLEPLRKLLDEGQITPEVYRLAKEKVLHAARTSTAQTPQTQPEPEPEPEPEIPPGSPFDWTATELRAELARLSVGEVKARASLAGVEQALVDAAIDAACNNPKAAVTQLIEDALTAVERPVNRAFSRASLGPISEPEKALGSDIASDASYQTPTSLPATPDRSNMSTQAEIDQTTHPHVAALETVSSREWEAMLTHNKGNSMDRDDEQLMPGAPSTEPRVASSETCATVHSSRLPTLIAEHQCCCDDFSQA